MHIKDQIAQQVQSNAQRNLLASTETGDLAFTADMKQLIKELAQQKCETATLNQYLDHTVQVVLASFYEVNQFFYFDAAAAAQLRQLYVHLLDDIQAQDPDCIDFAFLKTQHIKRLQQWLLQHYPEAQLIYPSSMPFIERPVVCAEYSALTQLQVLGIDERTLTGPILDIGCGKEQHLVNYLQQKGFAAYGVDREVAPSAFTFQHSWLDFSYQPRHWGSIISHLGFSNHFWHQHLRQSEWALTYAQTYRHILEGLQKGGSFYYTPHLPFVESYLDLAAFSVHTRPVAGTPFKATVITRLT